MTLLIFLGVSGGVVVGLNYGDTSDWCVRCADGYYFDGRVCAREVAASAAVGRCSETTVSYCRLPRTPYGDTAPGVCSAGRSGTCQYTCRMGSGTLLSILVRIRLLTLHHCWVAFLALLSRRHPVCRDFLVETPGILRSRLVVGSPLQ